MHYPGEHTLLTRVSAGTELLARPETLREDMNTAAKSGIVAGNVLGILYALSASPWKISEPSLEKAIFAAEQFGLRERFADGSAMPRGHTEIRRSFDSMRPVAHLWAAFRLHREYPIISHDDLLGTSAGVDMLLRIAKGIQSWALAWRPSRTSTFAPLLGEQPWIIPDVIQPLSPPWTHKPEWLLSSLEKYKRRSS